MNPLWQNALDSYSELRKILAQDVLQVRTQLDADFQSQLARRNYIRTLFAMIEGDTFGRKQVALIVYEYWLPSRTIFTPAVLVLLREEQYFLDDTGRAKQRELFLKIEPNLRFSLTSYGKAYSSLYPKATINTKLAWSVGERDVFRKLIRCRNRITHPKRACDLHITDDEVNKADAVLLWY